ncbi:uncharacterized protein (TIGR02217 family) [Rhizobium rosettiformans]|nr:DUF2460 domain-containing protein [Rhizobium rosettiformans]MBB5277788.1 uncharacterized protein (TIGR02217 family) [Rhizobium rosettiformans]
MAFHDAVFPEEISYGSKGGPQFRTTIVTLASGLERRNVEWRRVRAEYDVSHGIKDPDQLQELRNFFYARRGRAHSFRFKDWGDFEWFNQAIGYGDGTTKTFQLIKSYEPGPYQYDRVITKPEQGSLEPLIVGGETFVENGPTTGGGGNNARVAYKVNYSNGTVNFTTAPAAGLSIILPYGRFHVHARFDVDVFDPTHDFWNYQSWESIPIVEIKDTE